MTYYFLPRTFLVTKQSLNMEAIKIFLFLLISDLKTVNARNFLVKFDIVSQGIVQIIDRLSDTYHMRFTVVSHGQGRRTKDLACRIMNISNSPINYKHYNSENVSEFLNFDESFLVLYENGTAISKIVQRTKQITHRRTMMLLFNLKLNNNKMSQVMEDFNQEKKKFMMPHDVYQIAHSVENGSMWLLNNVLFFNGTCEPFYHSINFFNSTTMKWNSTKFFNEYRNFNNCNIPMERSMEDDRLMFQEASSVMNEARLKTTKFLNMTLRTFAMKHKIIFTEDIFGTTQLMKYKFIDETLKKSLESKIM